MFPSVCSRDYFPVYFLTVESAADEYKLVPPILNSDILDEEERQREEQQDDWVYGNDNKDRRQMQHVTWLNIGFWDFDRCYITI